MRVNEGEESGVRPSPPTYTRKTPTYIVKSYTQFHLEFFLSGLLNLLLFLTIRYI